MSMFQEDLVIQSNEVGEGMLQPRRSVRGLAIASICFALVWVYGFGSVFAIGLAWIAILQRNRTPVSPLPGLRLAVVGLVLGLIGLAVAVSLALG